MLTNYPVGEVEELEAPYYPRDIPREGSRAVPFSRELYIERDDFLEEPPKGYHRLAPRREVRLRYGYIIRCDKVVKDRATGEVTELRCSYDPDTRSGSDTSDRKVKGTIHWVSAAHALKAELRLYDRLFDRPNPQGEPELDYRDLLNPKSLETVQGLVEPSLSAARPGERFQFERLGYFCVDTDSNAETRVFNRIVALRDSWMVQRSDCRRARRPREAQPARQSGASAAGRTKPPARAGSTGADRSSAGGRTPAHAALTAAQRSRSEHYRDRLGLPPGDAALLAGDESLARFFEEAVRVHDNPKAMANWMVNELRPHLKDAPLVALALTPQGLAELVALIDGDTISGNAGKQVFAEMVASGGRAADIVERLGLRQLADAGQLQHVVDAVIAGNPDNVAAYRQGKTNLLGFFVGQVMKATHGKANPRVVNELLRAKLD